MNVGDRVQMADMTRLDNPIVDVVVVEVHSNGHLVVEELDRVQGPPKPRPLKRWITTAGLLSGEGK